jgi:hypothetical protein
MVLPAAAFPENRPRPDRCCANHQCEWSAKRAARTQADVRCRQLSAEQTEPPDIILLDLRLPDQSRLGV